MSKDRLSEIEDKVTKCHVDYGWLCQEWYRSEVEWLVEEVKRLRALHEWHCCMAYCSELSSTAHNPGVEHNPQS